MTEQELAEWRQEPITIGDGATVEIKSGLIVEDIPDEIEAEERALVVSQPQHHVVTGMAMLAQMDEAEFRRTIEVMKQGQARVKILQQSLMEKGEDYGIIKGIDRPFLHLPGAEKLINFYGLAVRQEAERLIGDGVLSPPLAYHVKSYVHVGSFDGPVVAMGYGEASSWEVKYRYTWAKAKCPGCGREGMIRGKADGKLKGKWWCPSREGGCNRTFEPNDPSITPPGKVENTDPYSLAETLIQMAAKRSFVAAARRATGTSGLFTQDEDSPSVLAQADTTPDGDDNPVVEVVTTGEVARGGKPEDVTPAQIAEMSKVSKAKNLGPDAIAAAITRVTSVKVELPEGDRGAKGRFLLGWIPEHLTSEQFGAVLETLETGEVAS